MPKMKFKYRYQFKKEINILNKLLNKLKWDIYIFHFN
jgi:hypothetical protein